MATSGSVDFNPTALEFVQEVLDRVRVTAAGETLAAADVATVRRTANFIIKSWQNRHTFLHARDWEQKTFSASSEVTGTDGNIYTCILGHVSAAASRPITGANYSTYWVQSGDTGGGWVTGTAYTAIGDFALTADTIGIEKAFIRDGNHDYQVAIVSLAEYLDLLDKSHTGRPYLLAFDRQLTPHVYLYYQPDLTTYVLHYLRTRRLEDLDSQVNTFDMPAEHLEALIAETAYRVAPKYNISLEERLMLKADAKEAWRDLLGGDDEASDGLFLQGAF